MGVRGFGAVMVSLTAAGCATGGMIPGTIYSSGGKILQFEIEKARQTGAVKAVDPTTGEKFVGSYFSVREAVHGSSAAFVSGRTGFASASAASNIANATAFLKGNQGMMLTCSMVIQAAISPSGIGECTDNHNLTYKPQFGTEGLPSPVSALTPLMVRPATRQRGQDGRKVASALWV